MIQVLKEPAIYPDHLSFQDNNIVLDFCDGTKYIKPTPSKQPTADSSSYISVSSAPPLNLTAYQQNGVTLINGSIQEATEAYGGIVTTNEQFFSGKKKFVDGIILNAHTTAYWQEHYDYIPEDGEIIVYTDYRQKIVTITNEDGTTSEVTMNIPGVKICGSGAYAIDQPFIGEGLSEMMIEHIENSRLHVSEEDREKWDNKVAVSENSISEEIVIFYK